MTPPWEIVEQAQALANRAGKPVWITGDNTDPWKGEIWNLTYAGFASSAGCVQPDARIDAVCTPPDPRIAQMFDDDAGGYCAQDEYLPGGAGHTGGGY